jgi:hypothetical protein
MEPALKEMGQLVVSVGRLVARQCDHYVRAILGADYSPSTQLFDLLTTSQCCKGRLLHYFAQDEVARHTQATGEQKGHEKETPTDDTDFSDWCGWHNDHGSLTGLVPAIYMKEGKLVRILTASHCHCISTALICSGNAFFPHILCIRLPARTQQPVSISEAARASRCTSRYGINFRQA